MQRLVRWRPTPATSAKTGAVVSASKEHVVSFPAQSREEGTGKQNEVARASGSAPRKGAADGGDLQQAVSSGSRGSPGEDPGITVVQGSIRPANGERFAEPEVGAQEGKAWPRAAGASERLGVGPGPALPAVGGARAKAEAVLDDTSGAALTRGSRGDQNNFPEGKCRMICSTSRSLDQAPPAPTKKMHSQGAGVAGSIEDRADNDDVGVEVSNQCPTCQRRDLRSKAEVSDRVPRWQDGEESAILRMKLLGLREWASLFVPPSSGSSTSTRPLGASGAEAAARASQEESGVAFWKQKAQELESKLATLEAAEQPVASPQRTLVAAGWERDQLAVLEASLAEALQAARLQSHTNRALEEELFKARMRLLGTEERLALAEARVLAKAAPLRGLERDREREVLLKQGERGVLEEGQRVQQQQQAGKQRGAVEEPDDGRSGSSMPGISDCQGGEAGIQIEASSSKVPDVDRQGEAQAGETAAAPVDAHLQAILANVTDELALMRMSQVAAAERARLESINAAPLAGAPAAGAESRFEEVVGMLMEEIDLVRQETEEIVKRAEAAEEQLALSRRVLSAVNLEAGSLAETDTAQAPGCKHPPPLPLSSAAGAWGDGLPLASPWELTEEVFQLRSKVLGMEESARLAAASCAGLGGQSLPDRCEHTRVAALHQKMALMELAQGVREADLAAIKVELQTLRAERAKGNRNAGPAVAIVNQSGKGSPLGVPKSRSPPAAGSDDTSEIELGDTAGAARGSTASAARLQAAGDADGSQGNSGTSRPSWQVQRASHGGVGSEAHAPQYSSRELEILLAERRRWEEAQQQQQQQQQQQRTKDEELQRVRKAEDAANGPKEFCATEAAQEAKTEGAVRNEWSRADAAPGGERAFPKSSFPDLLQQWKDVEKGAAPSPAGTSGQAPGVKGMF